MKNCAAKCRRQNSPARESKAGPGAGAQTIYPDVDASLTAPGFNHICLSVDSVDDTLAALRERAVDIVNPPFEIDDISARLAFFRDPWGNWYSLNEVNVDAFDSEAMGKAVEAGEG